MVIDRVEPVGQQVPRVSRRKPRRAQPSHPLTRSPAHPHGRTRTDQPHRGDTFVSATLSMIPSIWGASASRLRVPELKRRSKSFQLPQLGSAQNPVSVGMLTLLSISQALVRSAPKNNANACYTQILNPNVADSWNRGWSYHARSSALNAR